MSKNILTFFIAILCIVWLVPLQCCSQASRKDTAFISAEELKSALETGLDGVLLDVRTPGEVANGVLPGAQVIDFQNAEFRTKISQLDKQKTYYVYCHVGGRSSKAKKTMLDMGFTSVIDYQGGFKEWQAKGFPLEQR